MKIIEEGNPDVKAPRIYWWIGKRFTCESCDRVFELELKDEENPNVYGPHAITPGGQIVQQGQLIVKCENCGDETTYRREVER